MKQTNEEFFFFFFFLMIVFNIFNFDQHSYSGLKLKMGKRPKRTRFHVWVGHIPVIKSSRKA